MKNKLNKILSKNPDFIFYDHENECVGKDLLDLISKLLKAQKEDLVDKIEKIKNANTEDNMIPLEARLHKNDAYSEILKLIK